MKGWKVESDRVGMVLILPQKPVSFEMVFAQINKMLRRCSGLSGENLGVYMAAQLLDAYLIKSRSRRSCSTQL